MSITINGDKKRSRMYGMSITINRVKKRSRMYVNNIKRR